ncbi:MAG: metal-sensitive transcriptional regulator [Armatimonadota bacterium]|nr:metal-sensitive transcriptional regulator [Armatimonadota bacterium]MDR7390194.1 metal-sensitive transcriptional regulator [Armatimonadota bacterium]MDR7392792.1 metal-sensitive transcriptional regulator [Armatimonadota bacterium]MDR7397481.1 metal-sensitive transcriptional regulator [Armatimonadota bacterium]MDR7400594.1 metal-sensitive transcriptional regulator [Armatimonadota bacterium]
MATAIKLGEELTASLLARLRRIEGQVRGLQRMLEEGRDCAEVAQQVAATRAALNRVAMDLVAAGLEQCVRLELQGKPQAEAALRKLQKTLLMLG